MMLIDSHCHVHDPKFFPDDREAVYARAMQADVQMVVIGTSEADSRQAVEFAEQHDGVWAMLGVHPHDTKHGWQMIKQLLDETAALDSVVGVGEIGLDYFYDNSPRKVQIQALEEQLHWAIERHLPVSFHVRDAYKDFWPVFDNFHGVRGVLHSFTGSRAELEQALSRGLYIGVNGISTFTKDTVQQETFRSIPLERMLLETDAPFLTPVPFRGKVNEPVYVRQVAEFHATQRGESLKTVIDSTTRNTRQLLSI